MSRQKRPDSKISATEVRDALRRSGYLLEYRVERHLDLRGFLTDPNAAYPDPHTGKSREVDVLATKLDWFGDQHMITTELLIECVNNPQPIAFFVRDQGGPAVGNAYCSHVAGVPTGIPVEREDDAWTPLFNFLEVEEFHPYCKGPIATQFCSFQPKGNTEEWLAFHDEYHFDSARKLCHVIDHRVEWNYRTTAEDFEATPESRSHISLAVYWPIIVLQGELLEVRPDSADLGIRNVSRARLQIAMANSDRTFRYQMDVVTEDYLPTLLDEIEETMVTLHGKMVDHSEKLVAATKRLSTEALTIPSEARWLSLDHGR